MKPQFPYPETEFRGRQGRPEGRRLPQPTARRAGAGHPTFLAHSIFLAAARLRKASAASAQHAGAHAVGPGQAAPPRDPGGRSPRSRHVQAVATPRRGGGPRSGGEPERVPLPPPPPARGCPGATQRRARRLGTPANRTRPPASPRGALPCCGGGRACRARRRPRAAPRADAGGVAFCTRLQFYRSLGALADAWPAACFRNGHTLPPRRFAAR